ncbi:adaptor protein complex AP-2 alpha subunit [Babesia caballi]|uniref:AP-2 complex subunit alpha n=1 Tax=Babesia caballi TaxID=5871 RepID=A0AAV4LVM9_BABCB|nr:adaptor protein complex AP-2 alpha subunit [Babesia caballi]
MAAQHVRGLVKFITDVNGYSTDRERRHRVLEEVSKIRGRFDERGLSGYDKRKCILKLLYIHMLGYEIDVGYVEAVQLMASSSFQEKNAGYMGFEVLLGDLADVRRLAINTTLEDLHSSSEHVQALALNSIANSSCPEIRERVFDDVVRVLLSALPESVMLRKKLYMCVLQFLRLDRDRFPLQNWKRKMFDLLSQETDFGCLLALANLLLEFVRMKPNAWDHCMPLVIEALMRLLSGSAAAESYYSLTSPWLMLKLLTLLATVQPSSSARYLQTLVHVLERLVRRMNSIKIPLSNRRLVVGGEASHHAKVMAWLLKMSIAVETVRVIVAWQPHLSGFSVAPVFDFISRLLTSKSSHVYINALEIADCMLDNATLLPLLKKLLPQFLTLLGSSDPTVKCRTVWVASRLCDERNWRSVVPEMLSVLRSSNVPTQNFVVPLLLGCVEQYVPPGPLYVDFVFKVVHFTHDPAPLESVPRVLRGNAHSFGELVASRCITALSEGPVSDVLLRICATMLGEHGHLVSHVTPLAEQGQLLRRHFVIGSPPTQTIVLTTLAKYSARDLSLLGPVEQFIEKQTTHLDPCVQSTACELLRIMLLGSPVFESLLIDDRGSRGAIPAIEKQGREILGLNDVDNISEHHRILARSNRSRSPSISSSSSHSSSHSSTSSHCTSSHSSATSDHSDAGEHLLHDRLLTNAPGVLFHDAAISVLVEQGYRGFEAKLLVRVAMKDNAARSVRLKTAVVQCAVGLEVTEHNSVTCDLHPGERVGHRLSFVLIGSFGDLPHYTLDYDVELSPKRFYSRKVSLKLPIALHKFMAPLAVGTEHFDRLWGPISAHEDQRDASVSCELSAACGIIRQCLNAHVVQASGREAWFTCSCDCANGSTIVCAGRLSVIARGRLLSITVRGSTKHAVTGVSTTVVSALESAPFGQHIH